MDSTLGCSYHWRRIWRPAGHGMGLALCLSSHACSCLLHGGDVQRVRILFSGLVRHTDYSRYPVAGGQYSWVAILAPTRWARSMSYLCGWLV